MPISADLPNRRTRSFVLWSPRRQAAPPQLVVGRLVPGNPPALADARRIALMPAPNAQGLFEIAAECAGSKTAGCIIIGSRSTTAGRPSSRPPASQ
jgi:hypothetical protein